MAWLWNLGWESFKVIGSDTVRNLAYGFLFTLHGNCGAISVAAFRSLPPPPPMRGPTTTPSRENTTDRSPPVWEISTRRRRQNTKRFVWVGGPCEPALYRSCDSLVWWRTCITSTCKHTSQTLELSSNVLTDTLSLVLSHCTVHSLVLLVQRIGSAY